MDIFEMLTTILTKIKTIIKDANEKEMKMINIESRGWAVITTGLKKNSNTYVLLSFGITLFSCW